ncbi:tyramine oxidase subunit B [Corynebacterium sp. 153RC1]|uniref:tyramine oxidase subunit B n=1 Tax=unclassified Corynebacterium TaxID=2624378 RepID=UPI00211CC20F|nr:MULTISPECIES: tyramine oxidase subunit B [unclassified Corynebacterium]MCQ9353092.1 tyramine oxidase subunit B [Corynebacterium sp. 209RC1]MCQ9355296.1 tyramine oxidase subunit B [Corynebacterium sp. 1222RC1]MCQ9357583.1 tyramine oxidase subunit B [Corynebacterium sp. 122RC1]MCQ9359193.1 tyramine oxidase subunit B [Corynebacterium sp. 142RC1]MCQ9361830.1 tyramine oxidase subunit B [Corynebacterium sp. 153RC1]
MSNNTAIDFLYLSEPDMIEAGVTDIAKCIDVMEETLVLLADGDYRMAGQNANSHGAMIGFPAEPEFEEMPKDGPDRRFMAMPAYLGGRFRGAGVKWYGSNAENRKQGLPRSIHTFVLNDADTGAPKAIMSANLLSAYRTGAVPGVGVKLFAKEDAEVVGVVGPGVMARTLLEAVLALRPGITTIKVKGRSAGSTEAFVEYVKTKFPSVGTVVAVDSVDEASQDSDIIIAATTTDAAGSEAFPYFQKQFLKPGALLLLPAAARFDDEFILSGEARLVLDYQGLYDAWAEEYGTEAYQLLGIPGTHFHDLMREGKLDPSRLEQIGDISAGRIPGRRSEDEIILYSVGGMPVEDVAWATEVYETAREKGIGVSLPLWEAPALA